MSRPTVWVLKEQTRSGEPMDYTPAYRYGNIEFITDFDPPMVIRGSTLSHRWYTQVLKAIEKFDTEEDFLILTGSPLAIFLAGSLFAKLGDKLPKLLVYRREQNGYVVYDGLDILETLAEQINAQQPMVVS